MTPTQQAPTREARKAQLLKTWDATPFHGLRAFLDSLTEEESDLLLEAAFEKPAEAAG